MDIKLNQLEFDDVASWPLAAKWVLLVVIGVMILLLGLWFDGRKQLANLDQLRQEEEKLRETFKIKHHIAVNLPAYKEQMKEMQASFGALLKLLPEKAEVPNLIEDISHQGLAAGLTFKTIKLAPEKQVDFFVELPIDIAVEGHYHQLAEFVSNIASMPRIVTLHDFSIRHVPQSQDPQALIMNIVAETYRYTAEIEKL